MFKTIFIQQFAELRKTETSVTGTQSGQPAARMTPLACRSFSITPSKARMAAFASAPP
jgi:hypothetical protein